MSKDRYIINPSTGRKVKVGGRTHKKLLSPKAKSPKQKRSRVKSNKSKSALTTECMRSKVHLTMGEYKRGKLLSHGKRVGPRKQAIAIALSEARRDCGTNPKGALYKSKRALRQLHSSD